MSVKHHIHESVYDDNGKLTRECGVCGRDLLDDIHYRKCCNCGDSYISNGGKLCPKCIKLYADDPKGGK